MKYLVENQKRALAVLIIVFLSGVILSCAKSPPDMVAPPISSIRVVMDNNYPPYIFLDEDGNAQGILVDQWALWEKYTGVEVELSAIPWEDALDGMKNGEYDVIDTIFYTRERADIYDFTEAYARIDVPIFFHNNISGIAGLDDLDGFRLAVKAGDADAEFLKSAGVKNLVYYDSYEEIIRAAVRGEENIFVIDQPPGLYYLYKYGLQTQFNYSEPLFSGEFHRAVKKGDAALLNLVEMGFANIRKYEYLSIENRWFGTRQVNKWQEYLPYLHAGVSIVLLSILVLVVFTRTLQKRVNERNHELKQALADLQKSERWYREIFDAPTEAIFIQSASSGRILHVNKAMLHIFGYESEEEVISGGMTRFADDEPPYSSADALEKEKLAIKEGPQVFEWLARKKTGERFWTEVSLRYLEIDGEGQVLVVMRDISRRKQVEEALFESEARYRRLVSNAPDIIFRYDIYPEMKLTYINPAVELITGYTLEECYADPLLMLNMIHPDDMNLMSSYMQSLTPPNGPLFARWIGKDGVTRWMESRIAPVKNAGGQLIAFEGITRDITERKLAEESLQDSHDRVLMILDSLDADIYVADLNTYEILFMNQHMRKNFGDNLVGQICWQVFRGSDLRCPNCTNAGLVDANGNPTGVCIWEGRNPVTLKWYTNYDRAIRWIDGRLVHLQIATDITERKLAEESLRESEELYRKMNENSPLGMHFYRLDEDRLIFTGANPAADTLLGVDNSQFIGRSINGAFPSLADTEVPQRYRDAATKGIPWSTEQITYEDRQIKGAFEVRAFQTTPGNMVAVFADITARKQAEQLLNERERQYRTLVEQIPAIVYVDDVSKGIRPLYIGPQIEQVLGYNPQDWLAAAHDIWLSSLHPDDRENVRAKYLRCAEQGEPFNAEYRISAKDGRLLWLHDKAVLLRDENGNPQLLHGVMQDITPRKQAENEMRQRVMELEMLYESGLAINQLLDPRQIGQKIIELLEQKLGWKYTAIILYNPQDESLELLAFVLPGLKTEAAERFKALVHHSSQGVTGWVARHKQAIRLGDVSSNPDYVEVCPGIRSGLYVPMKLGDRIIGTINIESKQPDAFSAEDERLVVTLANQAASALENARLFEAERKQRKVSDALRDALSAGASMSASLEFENILDRLLEALERVVPFEGGSIMLVQPGNQKTRIARIRGYKALDAQYIENILNFEFDLLTVENLRWMFNNKQPLIISDTEKYPGWITIRETQFVRSWVGAPIIVNDEIIAFFSLDGSEPNFFTDEHVELLRAFTGQASLALQNARLFEQSQRRYQEFAALYETSGILSAEINLPDLLQIIVTHAKKLLNASSSGIYLYRPESGEVELTVDTASYLTVGTRLRLGEGVAGHVAQTRQPLRVDDYSTWGDRSRQYDGIPLRAVIEVPMLYGGELIGVLVADEIGDTERKFTDADEHLLSLFASQAAGAIHSARLRAETAHRLDQLQALHTIDRAISSSFDLRPILNTVITQTIAQLNVDAVDVLLYHPHLQRLEYFAGQGFRTQAIMQSRLRLGECLSGRAAFERRMIHVPNLNEKGLGFTRAAMLKAEGFLELYAVPLIAKGEVKGVLEVFHRSALDSNPEWLDFLETLAKQAAITIEQTQLFDNLQRANLELIIAYDATIEGWARAMDLRDKETESHTERVTELTIALSKVMGVKESEILNIRRGALLHDIGKMGVPDNILLKEGKLTEEEWGFMRRHPQFAYEMLQPIKYLRQALDIPYCHHEKWDGTGYPRGLKGEQIPLAARIFSIADVWDALTSDRPYRKAWTEEEALVYIREQSGRQFDPRVVEVFLKLIGD